MTEDIGKLVKFNIKIKLKDNDFDEEENCFALGKLYSDGFFYGFMCAGIDESGFEDEDCEITHLITGMYDKDLGLDLIRIPRNPNVAPILYRTIKDDKGYSGKFYAIQKTRYILFSSESNVGEVVNYVDVGDAKISVQEDNMDYYNYSMIRSIDEQYKDFLINPEFVKIYENSFKEESIKQLHEDVEKCYEETHGEQFGD